MIRKVEPVCSAADWPHTAAVAGAVWLKHAAAERSDVKTILKKGNVKMCGINFMITRND